MTFEVQCRICFAYSTKHWSWTGLFPTNEV